MPHAASPAFIHSAFYRFVPLPDAPAAAAELRALGADLGLNGAIVVAAEGLNGAVSGAPPAVAAFEEALRRGAVLEEEIGGMGDGFMARPIVPRTR